MSKDKESKEQLFESLVLKLDGCFGKLLADLPGEVQDRVTDGFPFSGLWDELTPEEQRTVAEQYDEQNAPNNREQAEQDFQQGFKKEKERINMINASELNRLNREKERQKRSMARKMKKIAKKPRDSRKKVSDERINQILDRKPEHIKKTNRATWLQGQLALEGVNISTTQLRRRLNALAG